MDAAEILGRTTLFRKLSPKQLKSLSKAATTRSYGAGQVIVSEGQTGFGLYCIQSGKVKVTKHTPTGEREIRTMGPGESFGEISLLDDHPRSATVTAVEPTTAVLLDKMQFGAELRTHPEVALSLLPALVQWLREADQKVSELT